MNGQAETNMLPTFSKLGTSLCNQKLQIVQSKQFRPLSVSSLILVYTVHFRIRIVYWYVRVTCQIDNSSPGAVTRGWGIRIKRMKPLYYACSCWLIISTKDKKSTYCNFPKKKYLMANVVNPDQSAPLISLIRVHNVFSSLTV